MIGRLDDTKIIAAERKRKRFTVGVTNLVQISACIVIVHSAPPARIRYGTEQPVRTIVECYLFFFAVIYPHDLTVFVILDRHSIVVFVKYRYKIPLFVEPFIDLSVRKIVYGCLTHIHIGLILQINIFFIIFLCIIQMIFPTISVKFNLQPIQFYSFLIDKIVDLLFKFVNIGLQFFYTICKRYFKGLLAITLRIS